MKNGWTASLPKQFLQAAAFPSVLVLVGFCAAPGLSAEGGAAKTLEDCEALVSGQSDARESALCLYRLAKGADTAAAARLKELSEDRSGDPWYGYYEASLLWTDGLLAQKRFARTAQAFKRAGEARGEVFSRINRIQLLHNLGRFDEARSEAERVFEVTESSDDPELKAWGTLTLVRELHRNARDLDKAWHLLKGVEDFLQEIDSPSLLRDYLLLRGNICLQIGRIDEGLAAYRAVVELAESRKDRYLEATGRYNLAQASFNRFVETPEDREARRRETIRQAREALQVAAASGNRPMEANSAWILARVSDSEAEALNYAERCLRAAEGSRLQSFCLTAKARILLRSRPEAAKQAIERSLQFAREAGGGWWELYAQSEAMRVLWATEAPREALAGSLRALEVIEVLRERQTGGSGTQAGMFSLWSDDYLWLSGRLLLRAETADETTWEVPEAFRVSERMRARALNDWIRRSGVTGQELERAEFLGLDELRESLGPGEALLSFQVGPWSDSEGNFGGGSWLMVIIREGVTVHRLPGRLEVRRAIRLFEGLVERRDGSEAGPAVHLYEKLLAPALAELPPEVERLILIPDDALHRLPFAALRAAPDAEPLGARYELSRVPSATLWLRWREAEPAPPERPLLVLADPELPAGAPAGDSVDEPDAEPSSEEPRIAEVRGPALDSLFRGEALGRLPHARREGRTAVRALGGGVLLVGSEASEGALAGLDLGSFGLLHFAAHAVTDEDRPERSAVLLADGPAGDPSEGRAGSGRADDDDEPAEGSPSDGLLEAAEIARLDLAGRTVVLASCRSADGTVLRGEGVMSLARAFFQAGSHGVIASLWPLRDDESAVLFERFYRRLGDGATVGEALHGARREAIEAGEPAAGWAGLVVLGDAGAVPVPGGRRGAPGWADAVSVAVLLLVFAGATIVWRSHRAASR